MGAISFLASIFCSIVSEKAEATAYCGRTKVRPTCCKRALQADPFSPIDSSTEHFEDSAGTLK